MRKLIRYFNPSTSSLYFDKLRTAFFINICFIAIALIFASVATDIVNQTENFVISIISKFVLVLVLLFSLFLLKAKGISIAGNFFSISSVALLLVFVNIVNENVDITFKFVQGFYSIFVFLIFGVLYASRKVIIINLFLVLLTTAHVFVRGLLHFPEKQDLLIAGYINHTIIVIAVSLVVLFTKKFASISIQKAYDELREKEAKNQELLTSEEEIRASNEELKATTDALVESNKELELAKEKAEESDRLKTEFLNNMSHEVRTPMNAIIGFSQLLNDENLDKETKNTFITTIQNSSHQLLSIFENIIEMSQLSAKQVKMYESPVLLNGKLREVCDITKAKLKGKSVSLTLVTELRDDECTVIIDEGKIGKVLNNLLDNAVRFTDEGSITFGYKVSEKSPEKYMLRFFVTDTGIGISEEKKQKVFIRFSQADFSLTRQYGGLGLGLSIAKENTDLLKGKISFESEEGKGTSFFVDIPVLRVL